MGMSEYVAIPAKEDTRDRVRSLKRGGETYTDLLEEMADQYDPEKDDTEGEE